jgi:thymidylate synthase (FAD)
MKIINASAHILSSGLSGYGILSHIEKCGRTCYQSDGAITPDSYAKFIKKILQRGHLSVIEHYSMSAKFICDRGVSHEIVRHRLASYSQESTRYCNYANEKFGRELTFIQPCFWLPGSSQAGVWAAHMQQCENAYFDLVDAGAQPEEARSVLPNSLKTSLVMTANLREWLHFFELRTAKAAHPQMREVAIPLLREFAETIPILFDNLVEVMIR